MLQLGLGWMSKSAVSRLCAKLDQRVTAFRERPLDGGAYPYLWLGRQDRAGCASRA